MCQDQPEAQGGGRGRVEGTSLQKVRAGPDKGRGDWSRVRAGQEGRRDHTVSVDPEDRTRSFS